MVTKNRQQQVKQFGWCRFEFDFNLPSCQKATTRRPTRGVEADRGHRAHADPAAHGGGGARHGTTHEKHTGGARA